MNKIIDVHTHIFPPALAEKACVNLGAFYNFPIDGKGTYEDLENEAREYGVCGFLLFSVATNAHQVTKLNDSIAAYAELSRSHGFETVAFGGMHQDFEGVSAELDRIEGIGLHGLKIHPDIQGVDIDDIRMLRVFEKAEGRMPVCLHMGDNRPQYRFSSPDKLRRVLEMFPGLSVIAAHLGGYRAWEEAKTYLAGMPNVMYDTSSSLWAMTPEYATDLIHTLGTKNVMFGTDYPVVMYREELRRFSLLGLNESEKEDILYNNAKAYLKA